MIKRLPCLFIVLLFALVVKGQNIPIVYSDPTSNLNVKGKLAVLEDPSNSLSYVDVISSSRFQISKNEVPNIDVSSSTFWYKFSITNQTSEKELFIELAYPIIDSLELLTVAKDGTFSVIKTGEYIPYYRRLFQHQNYIFPISIPYKETHTYFLKINTVEQAQIPIVIGTSKTLFTSTTISDLIFGLYAGLIIGLFFYNIFIYLTVKSTVYLYYILYIFFVGFTQACVQGYSSRFFYPNSAELADIMMVIAPALSGVFALYFFDNFLNLKRKNKYFHYGIIFFLILYTIVIVVGSIGYYRFAAKSVQIVAMLGSLFVLAIAARLSYKGSRQAKFFLVSWTLFLISVIIFVMKNFGVLPYNYYTYYALQVGSALEVILLSFALADKINILQAQTLASNAAALKAAQDSEQFMIAQNALLDGLVKERTQELEKTNIDLEQSFRNLQEKESQLVESEKMASLGQLTAGIAHEINNPINFVTSNVKPLKRDVDILVELVGQVEAIGVSEGLSADKQKQIEELKTDLDYDYLRNEIDYLLNGISDGASRTAEIVKGLRVFSRLDEDDLKNADINEGLSSTLVIVNHMLNNAVAVDKQYSGIPLIECYPGKLNQVFLNMMGNAIYAIHKRWHGQPGGKLTLKTSNDETHIHVSISDNGIGMDEATRKKLFEPFFTTKDVGEGTGLGLSIAYNTILKHNGTVDVVSEKGVGTEFIIKLPINQSYSING